MTASAFVLDASVALSWCFLDERTEYSQGVLTALSNAYAETPALWLFEVANVLTIGERRKRITPSIADEFLQRLSRLDIRMEAPLLARSWTQILLLARRHRLTAYDASYLELAQRKGLPLATLDAKLARTAEAEQISLMK